MNENNDNLTVTIGLSRYDELLDIESRKDVLIEALRASAYSLDREEVFRIMGYTAEAKAVREKAQRDYEEQIANIEEMEKASN